MKPSIWILATAACALHGMLPGARGAEPIDRDWWSLRPVVRPEVPELPAGDAARARTPVDRFVLAKLREMGLEMSPEADRRTLARRLYFDLIGLPPAPETVEAFVADPDPRAYEALVDSLLASTAYGERWARHWLDVVHYADTHGYDKDQLRPNAWPYRDYVIRAFNQDRPYGQFIREQLAGDVLFPDSADGVVATGFVSAGPWDLIGHAEVAEEKIDGKVARHLDRDDMVMTTMNTFCSITIQCAQCHDHKRDPVTMVDYYRMQAVFSALDRADRSYDADPEVAKERALLAQRKASLEGRRSAIETEIDGMKPGNVVAMETEMAALGEKLKAASAAAEGQRSERYGYHSDVAAKPATVKWVQVDLGAPTVINDVLLFGADEYGFADFGFPERFRIEVSDDPDFASGVTAIADFTQSDYPRPGALPARFTGNGVMARHVRVTATRLWSRRHQGEPESGDWIFALGELAVVSGGKLAPVAEVRALDTIEAAPRWGRANLVDGVYGARGLPAAPEPGAAPANESDRAPDSDVMRILDLAKTELVEMRARLEALGRERDTALAAVVPDSLRDERAGVAEELTRVEAGLAALPMPSTVYAATIHNGGGNFKGTGGIGGRPRPIHVLARGDVRQPREEVGPGVPAAIIPGAVSAFALPDGHAESARRVALAEWVTRPDNPLTWRSIVNRVWLYHFGSGIADSPNDFGRMGQLPSHPELLDWLAAEFRDGGQSIKQLHRLMVTSAVYRQASHGNPDAEAVDGGNRYLWRMNPRKLEAEALRDGMLVIAGKLDPTMYGPGFRDFVIEKPEHSPHYQYDQFDVDDASSYRRSVYRFIVRSQPQPFLNTLDCADPALLVDKRNETLTALQALALLNNAFVLRMAERFAERLEGESSDPAARIARAYALALGRAPSAEEAEVMGGYLSEHGLAAACRLILNLNEFTFVE